MRGLGATLCLIRFFWFSFFCRIFVNIVTRAFVHISALGMYSRGFNAVKRPPKRRRQRMMRVLVAELAVVPQAAGLTDGSSAPWPRLNCVRTDAVLTATPAERFCAATQSATCHSSTYRTASLSAARSTDALGSRSLAKSSTSQARKAIASQLKCFA